MGIDTSTGFVAFPRGLTSWEWYDEPNTCRLFFHLMLTVNWEQKNWHGIVVNPGSRVASIQVLATETGLTVRNVRTSLERLKSTGYLTIKSTNKYSVITLNSWENMTGGDKLTGKQATGKRQASDNQPTTTKPLKPLKPLKPAAKAASEETPEGDLPVLEQLPSNGAEDPSTTSTPETEWVRLGLGKRIGPALKEILREYRAAGIQDDVIAAAMREAAEHEASAPVAYVRKILERCQAQGITTMQYWIATHKGTGRALRVDRPTPSGNNFLARAMDRPLRRKLKN